MDLPHPCVYVGLPRLRACGLLLLPRVDRHTSWRDTAGLVRTTERTPVMQHTPFTQRKPGRYIRYDSVPSHDLRQAGVRLDDGTVLVPLGDRGVEGGTPFITVPLNAVAKGFVVWHTPIPALLTHPERPRGRATCTNYTLRYAEQETTAIPGARCQKRSPIVR